MLRIRTRRDVVARWGPLAWGLLGLLPAGPAPTLAQVPPVVPDSWPSPQATLASPQGWGGAGPCGPAGARPTHGEAVVPITSLKQLVRMSAPELEQLYRRSPAAAIPPGRVRGRALLYPGTRMAVPASNVARVMWQGKVIQPDGATAVNKFFGVRAIRGNLYLGESWLDGGPSLILDYRETSRIYAANRDEIREVAPGIYLGLMYARTQPQPTFKMFFALSAQP